jgi:RNA polymerase sigma-70 factor (ECF subfamily)
MNVLNSETTRAILEAIARLPARQAEVVRLRVLGGLSAAEVAEVLAKPPGTIRVLQHRALRQLAREVSRKAVTK